jgi:4a-hydroxytetrahydrobiopterin dehydratase
VDLRERERPLSEAELAEVLPTLAGWRREGATLTRTFTRKGFKSAIAFIDQVAGAANTIGHHPDIHLERYKNVRIVLTTFATGAVSRADVELARAIDSIA